MQVGPYRGCIHLLGKLLRSRHGERVYHLIIDNQHRPLLSRVSISHCLTWVLCHCPWKHPAQLLRHRAEPGPTGVLPLVLVELDPRHLVQRRPGVSRPEIGLESLVRRMLKVASHSQVPLNIQVTLYGRGAHLHLTARRRCCNRTAVPAVSTGVGEVIHDGHQGQHLPRAGSGTVSG